MLARPGCTSALERSSGLIATCPRINGRNPIQSWLSINNAIDRIEGLLRDTRGGSDSAPLAFSVYRQKTWRCQADEQPCRLLKRRGNKSLLLRNLRFM